MREFNDKIALLEMRVEQLVIYLRSPSKKSPEAEKFRGALFCDLRELVSLKERRQQLEETLKLQEAA